MARQLIKQGGTIDTVTPSELGEAIARATSVRQESSRQRRKEAMRLDGTGAGIITIKTTRLFDWYLERIAVVAGANGQVRLFENQQNDSDMVESILLDANGRYSDAFSNNLWIPAGTSILVVFVGSGANASASVNLQIRQVQVKH